LHVPAGAQTSLDAADAYIRRPGAFVALTAGGENTRWRIVDQPVPTVAYGDFDRSSVEPRETFELDSPRAKESSFLVALHFQKVGERPAPLELRSTASGRGFEASDGAAQVFFRSKPGPLTAGDLATDGDLLAVSKANGAEEIFDTNLKLLQRGEDAILSSNRTLDAAIRESADLVQIHLLCFATTDLKFHGQKPPSEVRLDQALVTVQPSGALTSFDGLAKGDHVISVRY
jgi:hypothetical protein